MLENRTTRYALALTVALAVAAFAALAAAAPTPARADGFIVIIGPDPHPHPIPMPRPIPPPPPRETFFPLAVKYHHVTVEIKDGIASTEVDQVFRNPNDRDLEGLYIFPMPPDAAVSKFSMWMDGKEVEGEVLDRDKARGIYEGIVREMRDPALLEYVGRGMFRARVFPIPARGEKRVKIAYAGVCTASGPLTEYRYPLNTEKFSSQLLDEVRIDVKIHGAGGTPARAVGNVFSATHAVSVARVEGGAARATFEAKNVRPERDFILYFDRADKEVGVSVVTHKAPAEDGYFLMLLAPRPDLGAAAVMPKDVVFVFDTSGSMATDGKIDQAKAALKYCLASLNAGDRFNIVDFATEVRSFREGLVPAEKEVIEAASLYAGDLRARGGTNIHEALTKAMKMQGAADRPFQIIFMTDGQPTIGITQPEEIEKQVKAAREERLAKAAGEARLFVFGVGSDLNAALLDRLAEANRGTREYVSAGESIEVKVSTLYDKVAAPVFSDLAIDVVGLETYDVYPKPLPDLFHGGEVAVVGRYKGDGPKAIKLKGRLAGRPAELVYESVFGQEPKAPFLPRIFAVRKVGYLLDQIRLHGENEEVKQEIVKLAKEFGIITPYTSYLVVEDEARISRLGLTPEGGRGPREDPASRGFADAEKRARDGAGAEILAREAEERRKAEEMARASGRAGAPVPQTGAGGIGSSGEAKGLKEAPVTAGGATAPSGRPGGPAAPAPAPPVAPGDEYAQALESFGKAYGFDDKDRAEQAKKARQAIRESVRVVEGRTFYLVDGYWVDAQWSKKGEKAPRRVKYLSDEYFALLGEKPALGAYLALGDRVRVYADGEAFEVEAAE